MRYENVATNTISIQINDNYSVIAMVTWNGKRKNYNINFYLKRTDIDLLDYIYAEKDVFENSDITSIKRDIVRYIETEYKKKTFKKYIIRYEYMLKCFDKGNDYYERNG